MATDTAEYHAGTVGADASGQSLLAQDISSVKRDLLLLYLSLILLSSSLCRLQALRF